MEYGYAIAAEVKAALEEASAEVGTGQPLKAYLVRYTENTGPEWAPVQGDPYKIEVSILDSVTITRDPDGTQAGRSTLARWEHTIKVATTGKVVDPAFWGQAGTTDGVVSITPVSSDVIEILDVEYSVADLRPISPGGVPLMWEIKLDR